MSDGEKSRATVAGAADTPEGLRRRIVDLERRLEEAEQTLRAIRDGEVDAFVVVEGGREKILTFETADRPYRRLVEEMHQGAALLDPAGVILFANAFLAEMTGRPLEALVGTGLLSLVDPMSRIECELRLRRCRLQAGRMELNLVRPDGELLPTYLSLSGAQDSDTVIGTFTDLTDQQTRKRLEQEVAERTRLTTQLALSEGRLQLALEAADLGVWSHDLTTDVLQLDARAQRHFALGAKATSAAIIARIHPDDHDRMVDFVAAARTNRATVNHILEHRIRNSVGGERWLRVYAHVVFEGSSATLAIGTCEDITERKQWEATQKLLLDELNHRVKNTLATIQAIAGQTLRATNSPGEFVEAFSGRLQSLGRAHSLLTQSSWEGADLADIVRDQLAIRDTERIVVSGPRVFLPPQSAVYIALVLHELGTNARKYGALCGANGRVFLDWSVARDRTLELDWIEREGPAVATPGSVGFGTKLIEQSVKGLGGDVRVEFAVTGLSCQISLPLDGG
ncbi:MAG: sensor histidine kinase [Rhodoplanes sp.]